MPVRSNQISRRIPPLRLKLRMIEMIAREFIPVTRQRRPVLPQCTWQPRKQKHEEQPPTPHESPQADSAAPPPAPDTGQTQSSPRTPRSTLPTALQWASENGSSIQTTAC